MGLRLENDPLWLWATTKGLLGTLRGGWRSDRPGDPGACNSWPLLGWLLLAATAAAAAPEALAVIMKELLGLPVMCWLLLGALRAGRLRPGRDSCKGQGSSNEGAAIREQQGITQQGDIMSGIGTRWLMETCVRMIALVAKGTPIVYMLQSVSKCTLDGERSYGTVAFTM